MLAGLALQQHFVLRALKSLRRRQAKGPGSALGLLLGDSLSDRRIVWVSFVPPIGKCSLSTRRSWEKTKSSCLDVFLSLGRVVVVVSEPCLPVGWAQARGLLPHWFNCLCCWNQDASSRVGSGTREPRAGPRQIHRCSFTPRHRDGAGSGAGDRVGGLTGNGPGDRHRGRESDRE